MYFLNTHVYGFFLKFWVLVFLVMAMPSLPSVVTMLIYSPSARNSMHSLIHQTFSEHMLYLRNYVIPRDVY
jgi:hypothetical protein